MNALLELQNRIGSFVAGRIPLEDFESLFLDSLWEVERSSDRIAQAGFHKIEGLLAEASHAHWSEDDIRKELANTLRTFVNEFSVPQFVRPVLDVLKPWKRTDSANRSFGVSALIS